MPDRRWTAVGARAACGGTLKETRPAFRRRHERQESHDGRDQAADAASPLRRFAEYNRLKNEAAGLPAAREGDAIWLAKVVAGRRFGTAAPATTSERDRHGKETPPEADVDGFKSASGVPQTDRTFDDEIVARMGAPFYEQVFQPAIAQAFREGKRYEEIRDTIRKPWKPGR